MTRHDNGERILAWPNQLRARLPAYLHVELRRVGYRFSIRNFFKSGPDFELKRGALWADWQIEFGQCPGSRRLAALQRDRATI